MRGNVSKKWLNAALALLFTVSALAGCISQDSEEDDSVKPNNMEYNLEPQTPPTPPRGPNASQSGCTIEKVNIVGEDPIESYILENEYLFVTIMKGWGAKVYNCIYKPTGHDIVWRSEVGRLMDPLKQKDWNGPIWPVYEIGGFDDCLPGVGECTYKGVHIPDHGESWLCPWEVTNIQNKSGYVSITMECTLKNTPFKVVKTLTLFKEQSRYLRHYKVTNIGNEEWPFAWGDHASVTPGGSINTGDRIFLPNGTKMLVYYSKDDRLGPQGTIIDWPIATMPNGSKTDLSTMGPVSLCAGDKLFSTELSEGWIAGYDPATKEMMAFSFPTDVMPYAGVWIDQGGHRGYQQMALEATNGVGDSIVDCVEIFKKYATLKAGESLEFDIWTSTVKGIANVESISPGGTFMQEKIKLENWKLSGLVMAPLKGKIVVQYVPASQELSIMSQTLAEYDCSPDRLVRIDVSALLPGIYSVKVLDGNGFIAEEIASFNSIGI